MKLIKVKSLYTPEELAQTARKLLEAVSGDDCPATACCSHLGVGCWIGNDWLSIKDSSRYGEPDDNYAMFTIYRRRNKYRQLKDQYIFIPIGYSARTHQARMRAVAKLLGAKILDSWNGGEGSSGISFVLDIPCPEGFKKAIRRYGASDTHYDADVFSKKVHRAIDRFDRWFEKRAKRLGLKT
jgi:hypothetical protein